MKRFLMTGMIAFAAMVAMPVAALAAPITGGISFAGEAQPLPPGTDWEDATGIDFVPDVDNARVQSVSGTYAALGVPAGAATGQLADFHDFFFSPFAGPHMLWDFTYNGDVFSYMLESVSIEAQGNVGGNSFLNLSGLGTLSITGWDDTPGSWIFTGNEAGGTFSFSASNAAMVPEPTLLALFGLGLAAAGTSAARRRRQA